MPDGGFVCLSVCVQVCECVCELFFHQLIRYQSFRINRRKGGNMDLNRLFQLYKYRLYASDGFIITPHKM